MRIKVRAWVEHSKTMLSFEELLDGPLMLRGVIGGEMFMTGTPKLIAIPMLWTGLKDKNGKEIYEGDIYRHNTTEYAGEVRFVEGAFYIDHAHLNQYSLPNINDGEVIGNIHQDKHLLKGE